MTQQRSPGQQPSQPAGRAAAGGGRRRRFALGAVGAVAAGAIGVVVITTMASAQPTLITVDSTAMTAGNCATAGQCTLPAALADADAANGTVTVVLPSGTFRFAEPLQLPNVGITIVGRAAPSDATVLDGGGSTRLFVASAGSVEITDVTLANGLVEHSGGGAIFASDTNLTIRRSTLRGNRATGDGGAIGIVSGALVLDHVRFSDNFGQSGGAVFAAQTATSVTDSSFDLNGASWSGGAMFVSFPLSLTVTRTTFTSNIATRDGGALATEGAGDDGVAGAITGSTFSTNDASGLGGAIFVRTATTAYSVGLTVDGSTFDANTADAGGAIAADDAPVVVNASNFTGNSVTGGGGAIASGGSLTVTGGTFTGNDAAESGGAIASTGPLQVAGTTFGSNHAGIFGGVFQLLGGEPDISGTFTGNTADEAGPVAFWTGNDPLTIGGAPAGGTHAPLVGAIAPDVPAPGTTSPPVPTPPPATTPPTATPGTAAPVTVTPVTAAPAGTTPIPTVTVAAPGVAASYSPLVPARLLETRSGPGLATVDGGSLGTGVLVGGRVTELLVAGRGGVPGDASAVVLNVAVVDARAAGFITVFPCGAERPNAANVNHVRGSVIANAVVAKVGDGGKVCVFSLADTDLAVDVNGFFPAGASYSPLVPARLLETRSGPGLATVDGGSLGTGVLVGGRVTELLVAGRGGVPGDASAVVLNVAVVDARAAGFITVFPCGAERPNAANVNHVRGSVIANAVVAKVGDGGKVCVFSLADTDLAVDVNGFFPAGASYSPLVPARLLETRSGPGLATVDGGSLGTGVLAGGRVTELLVAGRGGVPGDASAVVLNVAVVDARAAGFITVFPCGAERPNAANVNHVRGSVIANAVVAKVGDGGKVCVFSLADTDLAVDVNGYFPAAAQSIAISFG